MNITFQNQPAKNENAITGKNEYKEINKLSAGGKDAGVKGFSGINLDFGKKTFRVPGALDKLQEGHEKSKTIADIMQEASFTDVGVSQDYMTLMSHMLSPEDYGKMAEEGFDFASASPEEVVTIVDKIKAQMVLSGKHIAGYTDDLDMATMAAAVGSEGLARALTESFYEGDLPVNEETCAEIGRAWSMAAALKEPTDGVYHYMVDNQLEPEIGNLYLAQNSGAFLANEDYASLDELQGQMDQVLEQAGYEINEENRADAKWMVAHHLPLTKEGLDCYKNVKNLQFPVREEVFAEAVIDAIQRGKSPIHANLSQSNSDNLYRRAVNLQAYYFDDDIFAAETSLAARKQLEEIRLCMTAEVNVRLLKSGFSIDTAPMEELIEALHAAEKEVAESLFGNGTQAVSDYRNWTQVNRTMTELSAMPAALLGRVTLQSEDGEGSNLSFLHDTGKALAQTYQKAGESYEALMTVPRADLGDSMKKAFANAEELAKEVGMEPTEDNLRVIRILGYNRMEINEENVTRIRRADALVTSLMKQMNPAATLRMIRDGINPLQESLEDLNAYFEQLPEEYNASSEGFARFLHRMESSGQITDQEKSSMLGVFRLLRQVEKGDFAAVGGVVNAGGELTFDNLLSAVRSGKFKHMDVKATDETGLLRELIYKGDSNSISDQISQSYYANQVRRCREIMDMDLSAPAMLKRGEIPVNAGNLLAAQALVNHSANPYRSLMEKDRELLQKEKAETLWEDLDDPEGFTKEYNATVERLQDLTEELTFTASETELDVRMMQTTHRQLTIMHKLSSDQEYYLPMEVGGEDAFVHLVVRNEGRSKGRIRIAATVGESRMEAQLQVNHSRVEGYFSGNTPEEVTKLKAAADIFSSLINEDASLDLEAETIPVVSRENIHWTGTSDVDSQGNAGSPDNGTLYRVAKLFLQAIQ